MGWQTSLIISFFSLLLSLKMIVVPPIIIQAYDRLHLFLAESYFISTLAPIEPEIPLPLLPIDEPEYQASQNNQVKNVFKPPKDDAPDDTRGAGSRDTGHCVEDESSENQTGFQVFMPVYSEISAERPHFLVYIPPTTAKKLFFSLKDAEENYYYETTISIPKIPGEFSFELPNDAPSIEPDKEYTWSLALICDRTLVASDPMVQGVIRKAEVN